MEDFSEYIQILGFNEYPFLHLQLKTKRERTTLIRTSK